MDDLLRYCSQAFGPLAHRLSPDFNLARLCSLESTGLLLSESYVAFHNVSRIGFCKTLSVHYPVT